MGVRIIKPKPSAKNHFKQKKRRLAFFCGAVNAQISAAGSHTNLIFKFHSQEVGKSQLPKEDRS